MGIPIGKESGDTIYALLFVEDQVIIAQEYEDLKYMFRKLLEEYEKSSLKINLEKKTFCILYLKIHFIIYFQSLNDNGLRK